MLILYNFFIRCYQLAVYFATFWNPKAKAWVTGRKKLFQKLTEKIKPSDEIIWIHCASAGEFEQGKPIIESLKQIHPHKKVLVSFFSPSGYAAGKKYNKADIICFLPVDTRKNAERFLKTINPQLAVFVKYEYWYHHLKTVRDLNIPLLLISAIFRREQVFFKRYGTFYKRVLQLYTKIFVQDEESKELLNSINIQSVISGDTRFDRVATIAKSFKNENSIGMKSIKIFAGNSKIIVAGSTWPDDEKIIAQVFSAMPGIKLIIVPHEISKEHTDSLQNAFSSSIRYSVLKENSREADVLLIDNVGMLSRIYQFAAITYIGGGFNKSGIHNTLEAAVWGKPVIFGPNYKKFKEARDLVDKGGAFSIYNAQGLSDLIKTLLADEIKLNDSGQAAKDYVLKNEGATERIVLYIQENRLLTN